MQLDAVLALLRVAIRIADARAAIVAFDDEPTAVAFEGCSAGAAAAALRDGGGVHIDCVTLSRPATLVLLDPTEPTSNNSALRSIARELGIAVVEHAGHADRDVQGLAASIQALPDPTVIFAPPHAGEEVARFVSVNGAFERLFGYTARDLVDSTEDVLYGPTTNSDDVLYVRGRLAAGESVLGMLELRTREDHPVWIEMTARAVLDAEGWPAHYIWTMRDITARKHSEAAVAAEKQRLSVTLKSIADAVITALPDGRIDFINAAAQRLLNVAFNDAYGKPVRSVVDLRDAKDGPCEITFDPFGDVRGEGLLYGPERNVHVAFVSSPIPGNTGGPIGYVIVLRDVTAEYRLTRRLAYEASHDPLTRLPNRRRFSEMIDAALENARNTGNVHTVAFIDLDRFKLVNDTFGHQTGDQFLRDISLRMSHCVRGNDIVARLGGDEFALLLHECSAANARRVCEKVRIAVQEAPVGPDGTTLGLSASIGIAMIDRTTENAAAALANADAACYTAKSSGRNTVVAADVSGSRLN